MTTPPNRNADAAAEGAAPPHRPSRSETDTDERTPGPRAPLVERLPLVFLVIRGLRLPLVFLLAFAALVLTHWTLLGVPYYWDEAGYFVPAARDIYEGGAFVPHSTLSNAHPPLVMAYLALAWKLFGFHIEVARVAMLAVSAFALTGLFRLAERVTDARVAAATVLCTAAYPVFFAQSSLAHLDMAVAAFTLWALVFYLPPRDDDEPLRRDATPSQDDAMPLQGDVTPLQGDVIPLQKDVMPLRDDATALQSDATPLRDGVMPLRRGAAPLRGDVTALRDDAEPLGRGAKALQSRAACVALLALAALAKETAVLVPVTLCAWELLCLAARGREKVAALVCLERRRRSVWRPLSLLLACVPLALWFAYHRSVTGYTFGNPEYFRYNVESTLNLARVAEALWGRLKHVTFHMNLWVLTLAGLAAMFLKPRRDGDVERERIDGRVQLLFLALVLAHVFALSVVGGAVLARYMLPVLPLVILVWVSTLRRRVPAWPLAVALVCGAFAYRSVVNPPYNFPWEENLAYADFARLHRDAARFLAEKYPGARVLTAWPATDELRNPYYGYTPRALDVVPVESFKREDLEPAAARREDFDVALLYSTHGGLSLEEAADLLGAGVVFEEHREGQWVAVVLKR